MIARIDHVQVAAPAGGEGAARAFYGDLLGLPELPKPERLRARGGVWFAVGDQQLHVGIEESFAPARKAHPALAVPRAGDLSALAAKLEAAGRAVTWDGPRFYVEDPFGNRLELLAPHADLRVRALRDDERAWARAVLVDPEDPRIQPALEALARFVTSGRGRKLSLERVDGEPVVGSRWEAQLIELGFRAGPRKLTLRA